MSDTSIVERLRTASNGRSVWRVQNKDNHTVHAEFELWEDLDAIFYWHRNRHSDAFSNCELAKVRVHSNKDHLIKEAADMLEFFLVQMQMHSPKMDGQNSYRFCNGWPMTACVGPTVEDAVRSAIKEIQRVHQASLDEARKGNANE